MGASCHGNQSSDLIWSKPGAAKPLSPMMLHSNLVATGSGELKILDSDEDDYLHVF